MDSEDVYERIPVRHIDTSSLIISQKASNVQCVTIIHLFQQKNKSSELYAVFAMNMQKWKFYEIAHVNAEQI